MCGIINGINCILCGVSAFMCGRGVDAVAWGLYGLMNIIAVELVHLANGAEELWRSFIR